MALTRILHESPAAAAQMPASTALRSLGLLNVPLSTFPGALGRDAFYLRASTPLRDENSCNIRVNYPCKFTLNLITIPMIIHNLKAYE
jgi:hypothetical protein